MGSYIGGFVCAAGWYVYMAMALKAGQRAYEWDCKADPKDLPAHVSAIAPCGLTSGAYVAPGILMSLGVVMLNVIRWTALGDDMSLGEDSSATKAKIWVVTCFVIMFCALGGGVWIIVVVRVPPSRGCGVAGLGGGRSCQSVCRRMALRHSRYSRRPHGRSRTQLCGALIRRAPRCRRTGRSRRRKSCGCSPPSPSSCSASSCSWEASSSASSGAKRITPSEFRRKWSSPSECGGCGGCRLSLGRGRWLATQVSVISESYGGARTTEVLHLRPRCV